MLELDKKKHKISQFLVHFRGWIQAVATILTNIHLPNFFKGEIYRGDAKTVCVPGLNCYSCPAASGACPIGALQAVIGSSKFKFSYYITGFLILLGVLLGRFICGFLCPFGWFQELLHKIPTKKISTKKLKGLTYIKYAVLLFMVVLMPMFITNDVSLITFVPFAIIVLSMSEKEHLIIPVVVMQTIAANLGSMLMPMGNPQNLYLYAKSGMSLGTFVEIMLPFTIASLLGILISMFFIKQHAIVIDRNDHAVKLPKKQIILYSIAFVLCLLNVAKLLDIRILFVIILVLFLLVSRKTLLHVDYALLGTFIGFFVFIGNMERVPAFQSFLESIITGRETYIAIGASQIISNVPTALLLSGFTTNYKALIIGTNLGGLGTLIASMASLISYRQITAADASCRKKYILIFTVFNLVFLAILYQIR